MANWNNPVLDLSSSPTQNLARFPNTPDYSTSGQVPNPPYVSWAELLPIISHHLTSIMLHVPKAMWIFCSTYSKSPSNLKKKPLTIIEHWRHGRHHHGGWTLVHMISLGTLTGRKAASTRSMWQQHQLFSAQTF